MDLNDFKGKLPGMRRFTELPISVRHLWDSYPLVEEALAGLRQGQFLDASMLSDAVYTDDRVLGCLNTRLNALFGLPLEFKWPGQDETHSSVKPSADAPTQHADDGGADPPEIAELKKKICELAEKNWQRMLPIAAARDQVRWGIMLDAGIGELDWDWGADGLLWPTLKVWNAQFIYWRWDTRSYWLIHQDGQVELHPGDGRWTLYAPTGHNHGWLYGLIYALSKLWLDRQFAFRDWARASEKYSLGVIKGKVPADAKPEDKAKFEQTMVNLPNESFIILPQGRKSASGETSSFDVEMMQTDSAVNWQSFKERIQQLDVSIAVCLLGQNLSTEISKGGGSRAAAQVHDNVRGDFLKADDEAWSTMVRTQILAPWVAFNWGDLISQSGRELMEFVPEVRHRIDPPEDLEKKAKAIGEISQAVQGLSGTPADIHALLEQHGIPVLDQRATPDQPPPGGDVNERPPPPPGAGIPDNEGNTSPPGTPYGEPVDDDDEYTLERIELKRDQAVVDQVKNQLLDDFPRKATAWVEDAMWSGPSDVQLADVDFSKSSTWRAAKDGKLDKFVKKIQDGKRKPVVLIRMTGTSSTKWEVADGHHRALAYQKLGQPLLAYTGEIHRPDAYQRATEMHSQAAPNDLRALALARESVGSAKPGQRRGRVLIDDVVDGAIKAGAQAVAARKAALLRIVETSRSYDEMRERIKRLYFDARPNELRDVIETAMQVSHLIGTAAARADHREDVR